MRLWVKIKKYLSKSIMFFTLAITGCALFPRQITVPIFQIADVQKGSNHKTLLIFLPGRGDMADDYLKHDFFSVVRDRGLPVDMISVDAHIAYYRQRILPERLKLDVIQPAMQRGYENIWLVGVSMGGLGAMVYAQLNPGDIDGIIAIAPFMGNEKMIRQIDEVGGLTFWQPDKSQLVDYQVDLWVWLKGYIDKPEQRPDFYLMYGAEDRLSTAHTLFSPVLPSDNVFSISGGHNWVTWRKLWKKLLVVPPF